MNSLTLRSVAFVILASSLSLAATFATRRADASDDEALIKALASSKHTLADGIQQVSKAPETPISAKFEVEDGKLWLSVYTAEKGLGTEPEHNVLKEYKGGPEEAAWKPETEVFKDFEHIARSSQQLTLVSLSSSSLIDIIQKAQKEHLGTVYSVIPIVRDRKAAFRVLVADQGKSTELLYDVFKGDLVKPAEAGAPKR